MKTTVVFFIVLLTVTSSYSVSHAEPAERSQLEQRINALVKSAPECERLFARHTVATAASTALAGTASALSLISVPVERWNLFLRVAAAVLAGSAAGTAYAGNRYGDRYEQECSATAVIR